MKDITEELEKILDKFLRDCCDYEGGLKVDLDARYSDAWEAILSLIKTVEQEAVELALSKAQLPWPKDVFGEVPSTDWAKIDKFAEEKLGYRIDTISATLMRKGWAVHERLLRETVNDMVSTNLDSVTDLANPSKAELMKPKPQSVEKMTTQSNHSETAKSNTIKSIPLSPILALCLLEDVIQYAKYLQWDSVIGREKAQALADEIYEGRYGLTGGLWPQADEALQVLSQQIVTNSETKKSHQKNATKHNRKGI